MFDDPQANQTHNTNNDATDASTRPTLGGLGASPTPAFSGAPISSPVGLSTGAPLQPTTPVPSIPVNTAAPADLEEIKRHALAELSPLVNKLDQTPEEKYKTIMMMIQASDNQDLINEAYQNAQQITDEKAKAEALLNIVNEINYFTQKTQN